MTPVISIKAVTSGVFSTIKKLVVEEPKRVVITFIFTILISPFVIPMYAYYSNRNSQSADALMECRNIAGTSSDNYRESWFIPNLSRRIDSKAAVPVCQKALRLNPDKMDVTTQLARALDASEDPFSISQAARLYRLASDRGYAPAQNSLGFYYAEGRGGLPKSDVEAVRLFKLAADQGDVTAERNLGLSYAAGVGGLEKSDVEDCAF